MPESVSGIDWTSEELDAIVTDYFAMLADGVAGRRYVKAQHRAALVARLGRSNGSIEFKHQNISAVLDELGAPWIPGYKPRKNYQDALFDVIDAYLTAHPVVLTPEIIQQDGSAPKVSDPFVSAPTPDHFRIPERLRQLVRKYDPVERDAKNRKLGKAGEEFVLELEQRRLHAAGRQDLARNVRWISDLDGDGAGYDILSFDPSGAERLLEVKTTNGGSRTPFFLSRNEHDVAHREAESWRLYRVHQFATEPRVFTLAPPLDQALRLTTEVWHASF